MGWVFGTYVYNGNAPGHTVWEKMVPVGLMWGNDPAVTETDVMNGTRHLSETWLNPDARSVMQHYGWAGRLNGSVDNKNSSCLPCHSTAQKPGISLANALPSGRGLRTKAFLLVFTNQRSKYEKNDIGKN